MTLIDADEVEVYDLIATKDLQLDRTCWHAGHIRMEGLQRPLASKGRVWGYCYVVSESDLTNEETQWLFEVALVILLILINLSSSREEQEHQQADFIRDIIFHSFLFGSNVDS